MFHKQDSFFYLDDVSILLEKFRKQDKKQKKDFLLKETREVEIKLKRALRSKCFGPEKRILQLIKELSFYQNNNESVIEIIISLVQFIHPLVSDLEIRKVLFLVFSQSFAPSKAKRLGLILFEIDPLFVQKASELPSTLCQKKMFFKEIIKREREICPNILSKMKKELCLDFEENNLEQLYQELDKIKITKQIEKVLETKIDSFVYFLDKYGTDPKNLVFVRYSIEKRKCFISLEDSVVMLYSPNKEVLWKCEYSIIEEYSQSFNQEIRISLLSIIAHKNLSIFDIKTFSLFIENSYISHSVSFRQEVLNEIERILLFFYSFLTKEKKETLFKELEKSLLFVLEKTLKRLKRNNQQHVIDCSLRLFSVIFKIFQDHDLFSSKLNSEEVQRKLFFCIESMSVYLKDLSTNILLSIPKIFLIKAPKCLSTDEDVFYEYKIRIDFIFNKEKSSSKFLKESLLRIEKLLSQNNIEIEGFPFYQTVGALLYYFQNTKSILLEKECLKQIYELSCRIVKNVSETLSSSSPENSTEICTGKYRKTFFDWRTLRQTLQLLTCSLKIFCQTKEIEKDFLKKILNWFVSLLCQLRHRGAFHGTYKEFSFICSFLETKKDYIKEIVFSVSDEILKKILYSEEVLTTRRSGGYPLCATAISNSFKKNNPLPSFFLRKFILFVQENQKEEFLISAYNSIRCFISDTNFVKETGVFIPQITGLSFIAFGSVKWKIRNCALMVFQSCIQRLRNFPSLKNFTSFFSNEITFFKQVLLKKSKRDTLPLLLLFSKIKAFSNEDEKTSFCYIIKEFIQESSFSFNRTTRRVALSLIRKFFSIESKRKFLTFIESDFEQNKKEAFLNIFFDLLSCSELTEENLLSFQEKSKFFLESGFGPSFVRCILLIRKRKVFSIKEIQTKTQTKSTEAICWHAISILQIEKSSIKRLFSLLQEDKIYCGVEEANLIGQVFETRRQEEDIGEIEIRKFPDRNRLGVCLVLQYGKRENVLKFSLNENDFLEMLNLSQKHQATLTKFSIFLFLVPIMFSSDNFFHRKTLLSYFERQTEEGRHSKQVLKGLSAISLFCLTKEEKETVSKIMFKYLQHGDTEIRKKIVKQATSLFNLKTFKNTYVISRMLYNFFNKDEERHSLCSLEQKQMFSKTLHETHLK